MVSPIFDFSHLTPAERIELAEQLWDSLPSQSAPPTEAQTAELRRRRTELEADDDLGEPWSPVLDDLEQRGA
jgi:putative addiction module component (TIGR02574 family)